MGLLLIAVMLISRLDLLDMECVSVRTCCTVPSCTLAEQSSKTDLLDPQPSEPVIADSRTTSAKSFSLQCLVGCPAWCENYQQCGRNGCHPGLCSKAQAVPDTPPGKSEQLALYTPAC